MTTGGYRLVLSAPKEAQPRGFVYPTDAGRYSTPLVWFDALPYQRIPRAEPGAEVAAIGVVEPGGSAHFVASDGTVVRPAGRLHQSEEAPLFAERYSGAVHPAYASAQAHWQRPVFPATLDAWDASIRDLHRRSRRWVVAGAVLLAIAIVLVLFAAARSDGFYFRFSYFGGGSSGVGALASYRHARRSRRVADEARRRRSAEATEMYLRLWWSVGDGWGSVPVASLSETPSGPIAAQVPLAAVPSGYDPPDDHPVSVHGNAIAGDAVVIRDGEAELWPADAAAAILGSRRSLLQRWF